jgi:DNA uptake protein ComE-like DNA-binding protein
MPDPAITPPTPRQALIARGEQLALVILALALVAGIAYRAIVYWRLGQEPLAVVPAADGPACRVNVNAANWVELSIVPGLGPALARRIVALRDSRPDKRLRSLDELKEVHGIGDKVLAKLRPYLYVGEPGAEGEPIQMIEKPPA